MRPSMHPVLRLLRLKKSLEHYNRPRAAFELPPGQLLQPQVFLDVKEQKLILQSRNYARFRFPTP